MQRRSIKKNIVQRERFYIEYDDFIRDRPENRLIKSTLCLLLKASLNDDNIKKLSPLVNGNGRVVRLIMNLVLMQSGFNIALIPPVIRVEYISSIEQAHKNDEAFINLICRSVYETQKECLRMLVSVKLTPS